MSSWELVPVKRGAACKSRLAGRLSAAERTELVRRMLAHVVDTLRHAAGIRFIACVSEERGTIPADILVLPDAGGGLNAALSDARRELIERGADEILVLPADLPRITTTDIDALVDAGRRAGCALATDRPGLGTNALWLPASLPFRFQFGPASYTRHVEEACRLGLTPERVESPDLAFDVDGPDDLAGLFTSDASRYLSLLSDCRKSEWQARWQTRFG